MKIEFTLNDGTEIHYIRSFVITHGEKYKNKTYVIDLFDYKYTANNKYHFNRSELHLCDEYTIDNINVGKMKTFIKLMPFDNVKSSNKMIALFSKNLSSFPYRLFESHDGSIYVDTYNNYGVVDFDIIYVGNINDIDNNIIFSHYNSDHDIFNYFLHNTLDNEHCCHLVRKNPMVLKICEEQTDKLCMIAVKQNGLALQYVKEQNDLICLEAVKQNGMSLQYVKKQTEDICICAVKNETYALKYVNVDEMSKDTLNKIYDIVWMSNWGGNLFKYITNQSYDICKKFVSKFPTCIEFIHEQTHELCMLAIDNSNGDAIRFINNPTYEMHMLAVSKDGVKLKYINDEHQSLELCEKAVQTNPRAIKYVCDAYVNEELCMYAIKHKSEYIKYIKSQTYEMCKLALNININNWIYINNKQYAVELLMELISNIPSK
jgi:hypothetical protein